MKKINDFESYLENPSKLLEKDFVKKFKTIGGGVGEYRSENGESKILYESRKAEQGEKDIREYRKLYVEELDTIKELTTAGLKVLCYVLKNIGVEKDSLVIHLQDCMEFTGYKSKVNVYGGIADLLERQILYRKVGVSNYFININCFYSGDRFVQKEKENKIK